MSKNAVHLYEGASVITSVACSPYERSAALLAFAEGSFAFTATYDKSSASLSVNSRLHVGCGTVCMAFSPKSLVYHTNSSKRIDGEPHEIVLAVAADDHAIRVFSNTEGADSSWSIAVISGHTDTVNSLAFNYDGSILASSSSDRSVRLFSVESQTCVRVITCSSPAVAFIWHPHNQKELLATEQDQEFVVVERCGNLRLYHRDHPRPMMTLTANDDVADADWCATNTNKLAGFSNGQVAIWEKDLATSPHFSHDIGQEAAGIVRFSKVSDRIVAVASVSATVVMRLRDDGGVTNLSTLEGHASALTWHAVSSTLIVATGCRIMALPVGV